MKHFFIAVRTATVLLLFTLFFISCEQEDLSLLSSTDLSVQPAGTLANATAFIGRIAITSDGNDHDRDDIAAAPLGLAMIAQAGLQSKLVHYDYNSHIWSSAPVGTWNGEPSSQKQDMTESTLGAASHFNFNKSVFISAIDEKDRAEKSIADAVNKSSASDPLYILVCGPVAVICEGIRRSDPSKRKYVTVISHSVWNNEHTHNGSCTIDGVIQTGVKYVKIRDQNPGFRQDWPEWDWLKNHSNSDLRWVYQRMVVSRKGDASDSGVVWYLLKNDENGNLTKLKAFFAGSSTGGGGDTPDDGGSTDGGTTDGGSSGGGSTDDGNCYGSGSTLGKAIDAFEKNCGVTYDKTKGHDCDPDGKGGWICSSGKMNADSGSTDGGTTDGGSSGGGSTDGGSTDGGTTDGGSSGGNTPDDGNCYGSGSTLGKAIDAFEKNCGVTYDKTKGHDCDPDGKGGWICSSGRI